MTAARYLVNDACVLLGQTQRLRVIFRCFRELKLRRNPECPVCGNHPTIRGDRFVLIDLRSTAFRGRG